MHSWVVILSPTSRGRLRRVSLSVGRGRVFITVVQLSGSLAVKGLPVFILSAVSLFMLIMSFWRMKPNEDVVVKTIISLLFRAAAIMMKTGTVVTLKVAKFAASHHGLEPLLSEHTSEQNSGKCNVFNHHFLFFGGLFNSLWLNGLCFFQEVGKAMLIQKVQPSCCTVWIHSA